MTEQEDWGVPNWRDANAYPKPDELTETRWRWEFTRRRNDYREDWLKYSEETIHRQGGPQLAAFTRDHRQFRAQMPGTEAATRYGLPNLPNPALASPRNLWFVPRYGEVLSGFALPDENHAALLFDLRAPISPQVSRAEEWLESRQRGHLAHIVARRGSRTKWPVYLRVLDAHDAGETFEQMGKV